METSKTQKVNVFEDSSNASKAAARQIAQLIETRNQANKPTVLGLATGHSPIKVYAELIRMHRQDNLDFSRVITFNLDEYWGIEADAYQSYHRWMHENFFDHVNIPAENIHLPSGMVDEDQVDEHCRQYELAIEQAGGIDFQILGIGRSGHIAFNEPGSSRQSVTHRVVLDRITRMDAASDFFGERNVPEMAITMGIGSVLKARQIVLLAFGEHKAPIIGKAIQGPITESLPASFLQEHPDAAFYLDQAAAADLKQMKTPWLVGACQWDEPLRRRAVIWLAKKLDKPILKLTDADYAENGLYELLRAAGGAYGLNIAIFKRLMNTITGHPCGKKDRKKVLILSPHPDDDVICMGGTMSRMVQQGHEVHVGYMVSGCLSVFDHDVSRYTDFVREISKIFDLTRGRPETLEEKLSVLQNSLENKKPGDIDLLEVQAIKGRIRRAEAIDAARVCGIPETNLHFLEMPFYNTGKVQKLDIGDDDIQAVQNVYDAVKPDTVFAAGDLSDPHGTHFLCLQAALTAMDQYIAAGNDKPELWLYRGAWQEWAPEHIDMAVPLSPDELSHKRHAIFRHQSQKDRAMFPGPFDSREFWQRAEDRNMATAAIYDQLGLPEYHAIEAFVRYPAPLHG